MESGIRAVLWDFDGTMVDTEPYWIDAEYRLIESYGASWSHEDALQLVGNSLIASAEYIIKRTGIPLSPPEVVERLLDSVIAQVKKHVPWRPGARELLADLQATNVPCALVTMSYRRFVDPVLATLPAGTFQAVVTGDVVTRGKPHPDPYLEGASALGFDPVACLAIEDSATGSASALAAGCPTIVVPLHVAVVEQPGMVVLPTLPRTGDALSMAGAMIQSGYRG